MGKSHADTQQDNHDEEGIVFYSPAKKGQLAGQDVPCISESKTWNLVKGGKPRRTLILNLIQSELSCERWFQELFFKRSHVPRIRIPKHLVSFDEKYLRQCMELIHMNATKGAPCALSMNFSSSNVGLMSDQVTVPRRSPLDMAEYAIDYPVDVGGSDYAIDEDIVGSIMGSPSMMSILSSPLFQRLGISDSESDASFGSGSSLLENKRCPPPILTCSSLQKAGKDTLVQTDQSPTFAQGMLNFRWDGGGIPHFSLALDDSKEVYVAHLWNADVKNGMDYLYSFHVKPSGQSQSSMSDLPDHESDLIGKMKVSSSVSLASNNSRIIETKFVMVDMNSNHARDMRTMSRHARRSRRLSRVIDLFKTSQSKGLETHCQKSTSDDVKKDDFVSNSEMAAIVVKDLVHDEGQKRGHGGGWGLKFLKKKAGLTERIASRSQECCLGNVGECCTSMDVILPTGPHGGTITKTRGGPSGLIERWRQGGGCDCGGWDLGCPLKVLKPKPKPRMEDGFLSSEPRGDRKSFDFFLEGSKQDTPTLKMVNIHEGSYFISFKSSYLSALQCFSIAVAIVHSQSAILLPKHVQD